MTNNPRQLFKIALALMMVAILGALLAFFYQATFTRYHADDYCASVIFASPDVPKELVDRYVNKTGRYSNILYIGMVDPFDLTGIRFAPAVTVTLWLFALAWLSSEIRRLLRWEDLPALFDWVAAGLVVVISVYSAPNRFQTFYWRSGASTHFIPVVFLSLFVAYLLWRNRRNTHPTVWTFLFIFIFAFFTAGFSEPPAATMITIGILSIALLLRHGGPVRHRSLISMLACALIGSIAGLSAMFFAPGAAFRLGGASSPDWATLIYRIVLAPSEFLMDTLRVVPVPTLFLLLASVGVFFCVFQFSQPFKPRPVVLISLAVIVFSTMYLLIAASFAPSIYGQTYPAPRARFLGYLLFNVTALLTGGLIGAWLAGLNRPAWSASLGLALVVLLAVYPLRIASSVLAETRENRAWAQAWDSRDAEIRSMKSQGLTDLTVEGLPQVYDVGELKPKANYVNNCAARFYGVESILTVSGKTK